MKNLLRTWITVLVLLQVGSFCFSFTSTTSRRNRMTFRNSNVFVRNEVRKIRMTSDSNMDTPLSDEEQDVKVRLEEKMAEWENMPEASGKKGVDGFDLGLWVMFPFIVATSLLFFVFPFIMDKIDVSSVGPPPTV